MQQRLLSIMLVLALVMVGTVSAQDDPLAEIDPTGATIMYWHEWDGAQGDGITAIIDAFNADNEWGITVEQNPLGGSRDVRENLSTGITSGDLPNLGGAGFITDAMGYFLDGVLVPLDQYVDSPTWGFSEAELADLNLDVINTNRPSISPFDGQLLAWPIGISGDVMSVNLDLLADMNEAGLIDFEGAPTNFDQFSTAACSASELEGVTAGFAARPSGTELYSFILNFGGEIFDEEADAYTFTNEGAIAAMEYLQGLFNDGCMYYPDGGNFANTGEFSLGLNTFAVGSSVGVPFIQGDMDAAELDYNWINTTVPWTEGNRTVVTSLRGVTMLESTPEENLATWLFIKYWATNQDAQVIWTESAQYQPYNTATPANLSAEFVDGNAQFASYSEVLADPNIRLITFPVHPRSFDVSLVAGELYSNITIGGMDIAEAAAEAEEEANEIYQEDLENIADF